MAYYGEFGGRVLRKFQGPNGIEWIVGAHIPEEVAEEWPIANRKALFSTHKVEWYGPPVKEKEIKQRPAPAKVKKEDKIPIVKTANRTNRTSKRGTK
jgi:hypothetical protein